MSLPMVALILLLLGLALLVLLFPSLVIRVLLVALNPWMIFVGPGRQKRLALTIDDGPSGAGSDAILELLQELKVPATFFLIGSHLQRNEHFPRQALAQGHELGNHLWRDERAITLARPAFEDQLRQTEQAIEHAVAPAQPSWRWFRPGGGWFRREMGDWLAGGPYRLVLGSIFPWDTLRPSLWFVRLFIWINAHPGGILVLHDTPELSARTALTLRRIIPDLRRRGYRFVPLGELLAEVGPTIRAVCPKGNALQQPARSDQRRRGEQPQAPGGRS